MKSSNLVDKLIQQKRFAKAKPFLIGDVLDFGGNRGELKSLVSGAYRVVNNQQALNKNIHYDTIVCLAVIEHINQEEVFEIFTKFKNILKPNGRILLTTPTPPAKLILELLGLFKIIDTQSLAEHKHYWPKKEILDLAEKTGLVIKKYKRFELGLNQFAIFERRE